MTETRRYTIDENTRITVIFTPEIYTATVAAFPPEAAKVTFNSFDLLVLNNEIAPRTTITTGGQPFAAQGSQQTAYTYSIASGFTFIGWSIGQPLQPGEQPISTAVLYPFTFDGSITLYANYSRIDTPTYTITVVASPPNGGNVSVTSRDGGQPDTQLRILADESFTLFAEPRVGFTFARFIDESGTTVSVNQVATQSQTYTAIFTSDSTPPPSPPPPSPPPPPPPPPSAPIQWRLCSTGELQTSTRPDDYRQVPYTGPGGGTCWEPISDVGFVPALDMIEFTYQRASGVYPDNFVGRVDNSSFGLSYTVTFETNPEYFTVSPRQISLSPQSSRQFTITINRNTIEQFNDGQTEFDLRVNVEQV